MKISQLTLVFILFLVGVSFADSNQSMNLSSPDFNASALNSALNISSNQSTNITPNNSSITTDSISAIGDYYNQFKVFLLTVFGKNLVELVAIIAMVVALVTFITDETGRNRAMTTFSFVVAIFMFSLLF